MVKSVAIDLDGNIYSCGTDKTVRKVNSSGVEVWSFTENDDIVAVAVDRIGNVIIGSFSGTVRKLDPDGNTLWVYTVGSYVRAIATDASGFVYLGAEDGTLEKLSPVGGQIWEDTTSHTGAILGIAVGSLNNIHTASRDNGVRKFTPAGVLTWTFTGHTSCCSRWR